MAKAPLLPLSLLVHVVLAASFPAPCTAQGRTENISAVEAAVRARASELLRDTTTNDTTQPVDLLPLPGNLSGAGVRAWALRVSSNALWADGVNAAGFVVPPRVVPAPFARCLTIVFERFTGGSAAAFAAPRLYALAAPVAGFFAYDAAAGPDARVSLRALGAPVRVEFDDELSAAALDKGFDAAAALCVTFAASGEVVATYAVTSGSASTCAVTGTGHFGIVVRLPETPPPASAGWWAWTVGVGAGGVLGASVLALSVAGAISWSRRRRWEEMERRAMAGEELGRMTVRGSRMPSAKVVRTRPELEEPSTPP
ncbi:hypothetical protein Zm00014a_019923 [Zea mays]|jgi:hypothetical protein|uniref:Atpob1 n=2 Tax=Zea mays TaxID=4577 RepID=K7VRU5_MAIZE|nr:uncharacterized protein LOC103638045 [Zea mays]AQL01958.1 Atpob1 [Zea mays]PWZ04214.1 hypothetical protein Zm00014a_019923 [Zea mays]|eukprot:XP_008659268.1 uncharacterized protein LOC103638045 [Zea mays]